MDILIACEFSGIVREAFREWGHNAVSCDLLPSEIPGPHIQDNVLNHLDDGWDMMIAHPYCTDTAVSGARWFPEKQRDYRQQKAIVFFMQLALANIKKKAIEHPISIMSTIWKKPDQIVHPHYFIGGTESKATCLWLFNLPNLERKQWLDETEIKQSTWRMGPSETRGQDRSRTFPEIARAMAFQWGAN